MRFYSVQSKNVWENICATGIWKSDSCYYISKNAYAWMLSQMRKRLTIYNPSNSIIWLWGKTPDLRRGGYGERGDEMVLLEVNICEDDVLCSDFDAWNVVLMDLPITKSDNENISKIDSWNRVFDIQFCIENKYAQSKPILQFVTGELDKKHITFIKSFICK